MQDAIGLPSTPFGPMSNQQTVASTVMDRRPSLALAVGSPEWARQAVRDAKDPFFEFVNQEAVEIPMLAPDQQPRFQNPLGQAYKHPVYLQKR